MRCISWILWPGARCLAVCTIQLTLVAGCGCSCHELGNVVRCILYASSPDVRISSLSRSIGCAAVSERLTSTCAFKMAMVTAGGSDCARAARARQADSAACQSLLAAVLRGAASSDASCTPATHYYKVQDCWTPHRMCPMKNGLCTTTETTFVLQHHLQRVLAVH